MVIKLIKKYKIMAEGNKFMNKYGAWVFIVGVVILIVILKLIGFPEILTK